MGIKVTYDKPDVFQYAISWAGRITLAGIIALLDVCTLIQKGGGGQLQM